MDPAPSASDAMMERVQRAMIEASLSQNSSSYNCSKRRSAMDELFMDLKALDLTQGGGSSSAPHQVGWHIHCSLTSTYINITSNTCHTGLQLQELC